MNTSPYQHISRGDYWRFAIWAGVVLLCSVLLVSELRQERTFDTSIMALLPATHQNSAEALAQQRFIDSADDRMVFLVAAPSKAASLSAAEAFAQHLQDSDNFDTVQGAITDPVHDQWQQFFYPWRYQLLTHDSLRRLQQQDTTLINDSLTKLYSPLAAMIGPTLTDDPLQLYWHWQTSVLPHTGFELSDQWLTLQQHELSYRLLNVTLRQDPYNMDYQQTVMATLQAAEQQLPPEAKVLMSGLIIHAAYGAQQAQHEISTIGTGSILGILLLLLASFRYISRVLLAFLPLMIGSLVAMSLSLLIFDRIHLITLAFGASLIGVAIDYSLHYFCVEEELRAKEALCAENKPTNPAHPQATRSPLRHILPGLVLGLLSTVMAYAAQAAAPFPGLQQMALFSVFGLIGAWITVTCWLPLLSAVAQHRFGHRAQGMIQPPRFQRWLLAQLGRLREHWLMIESRRSQAMVLLTAAALIAIVCQIQGNDDLRLLQTSPTALLQEDGAVHQLLAGPSPSQYFILQAHSEQALLEAEEAFTPALDDAKQAGLISDYQATSQYVPSISRQRLNRHVYAEQVFADDGLLLQWAEQGQLEPLAASAHDKFTQSTRDYLTLLDWQHSNTSELARHLWLGEHDGAYYSVITLSGIHGAEAIAQLAALASAHSQVVFSDRIAGITHVLKTYRQQLTLLLLLAYGLIGILLSVRFRWHTWRIMAAPALASLITFSSLHLLGIPITIFHTLALLLLLGVGLDASIFLYENHNAHTWMAVTLASSTTLLSFGLLTLSETPVLHFFGQTVLIGIVCIWFLSPIFTRRASSTDA